MINKYNIWLMVCIVFFAITKITALICAAVIAIQGNLWVGAGLFVCALIFKITWTFTPTMKEMEKVKDEEIKALKHENDNLKKMITRNA